MREGWIGRLALLLLFLILVPSTVQAAPPRLIVRGDCHSVTARGVPDDHAFRLPMRCTGEPVGYAGRSLWISVPAAQLAPFRQGATLLIHHTRADRIVAIFRHASGRLVRQSVRAGDYDGHWRVGAQIAFTERGIESPITGLTIRLDGLASHRLLRARIVPPMLAAQQMGLLATLIGAAEVLLLLGATYNLGLGIGMRRADLAWQGGWAATLFLWGLLWSQLALVVAPGLAGTAAASLSTFLSCLAVTLASFSVATALRGIAADWLVKAGFAMGLAVLLLALPYTLDTELVRNHAAVLNYTVLAAVAIGGLVIASGWRRGSPAARTLGYAWGVPMLVLAVVNSFDVSQRLYGGGPQVAVLFACAAQTAWLSIAATLRFAGLRLERDAALAAGRELTEIARRDPLTGLLNRRGYLERTAYDGQGGGMPVALLLIDIDLFKSINDRFGHEAGDDVLISVANCLRRFEQPGRVVARLGGEEFLLGTRGLGRAELAALAEEVRGAVELEDHAPIGRQWPVTISIGVAEGVAATPFQKLYGMADRALYAAKAGGRNRVAWHRGGDQPILPDQISFSW